VSPFRAIVNPYVASRSSSAKAVILIHSSGIMQEAANARSRCFIP